MRRIPVPPGFLDEQSVGDIVVLPDDASHYLRDVLRARPEDRVELFDGRGICAYGELTAIDPQTRVQIQRIEEVVKGESPLKITLFQAIPKGKRWEWILEKATELGVHQIVPLQTKRTIVDIPEDRLKQKMERWQKILVSAARQCGRSVVPKLANPLSLHSEYTLDCELNLVAHMQKGAPFPGALFHRSDEHISTLGMWIGPEGGFTDDEVENLLERGAHAITLGPRILRADTAPITALTLLQSAGGDLFNE